MNFSETFPPLRFKKYKDLIDIQLKNSYIKEEPFNSLILAEILSYLASVIKQRAIEHLPSKFEDTSTVTYGDSKFTLRRTPVYEYPQNSKLLKLEELVKEMEQTHKQEVKGYKDSIKTIKEQLIQSGEARMLETKHSIVIK